MKNFLLLFALLSFSLHMSAQSRLVVNPGLGTLEDAITNDANPPADRVYVLKRGGAYLLRGIVINTGYVLRLEAEVGTGAKPLIAYSAQSGVVVGQLFETKSNLEFKNIAFTARDLLNNPVERIFRVTADNIRITLDSCFADDLGQSFFRIENVGAKVYVTNSIFSRMGDPKNPDNGRFLDKRGPSLDTVVIENCIMYNITSRIIRDGGASNISNHIRINQNTFWGVGQRCLAIGKVKDLVITNNIFQNCAITGTGKFATNPTYIIEPDSAGVTGRNWTIRSNNFSSNPQVVAAVPTKIRTSTTATDTAVFSTPITPYNPASAAIATNTFSEIVTFRNAPVLPDYFVTDNRSDTTNLTTTRPNARAWNHSGIDKNTVYSSLGTPPIDRFSISHDFGYGTWRAIYKGGTTGQPIGARLFAPTTSLAAFFDASGVLISPNPVNDRLLIGGLEVAKVQRIEVYNLAGQVVKTQNTEGVNIFELPVQDLNNGMYLLKMTNTEGKISSRKFSKM